VANRPDPSVTKETEGEGSRSADRKYREEVTRYAQSGKAEGAAREAEEAIDSDEKEELDAAEKAGKARAASTHDQRGEK
jgi:hypothetical protein